MSARMIPATGVEKYESSLPAARHCGKPLRQRDLNRGFLQTKFDSQPEGILSPLVYRVWGYDRFKNLDWRIHTGAGEDYIFDRTESSDFSMSDAVLLESQEFDSFGSERTFRNSLRRKLKQKIAPRSDFASAVFDQPNLERCQKGSRIAPEPSLNSEINESFAVRIGLLDNCETMVQRISKETTPRR